MATLPVAAMTAWVSTASVCSALAQDDRAARLLAEAREKLGGAALARVESVLLAGTERLILYQGTGPEFPFPTKVELRLAVPDSYLYTRIFEGITDTTGLVGGESYSRMTGRGVVPPAGRQDEAARKIRDDAFRRRRRDATRLLIGVLLSSRLPLAVTWAYGGRAESPEGRAEVLIVTGPEDFALQLMLDERTLRPLMMTFEDWVPVQKEGPLVLQRFAQALYFGDHREVSGVWLPKSIVRTVDGRTVLEWRFTMVQVNPRGLLDIVAK